jgi:hypothetical protein
MSLIADTQSYVNSWLRHCIKQMILKDVDTLMPPMPPPPRHAAEAAIRRDMRAASSVSRRRDDFSRFTPLTSTPLFSRFVFSLRFLLIF